MSEADWVTPVLGFVPLPGFEGWLLLPLVGVAARLGVAGGDRATASAKEGFLVGIFGVLSFADVVLRSSLLEPFPEVFLATLAHDEGEGLVLAVS